MPAVSATVAGFLAAKATAGAKASTLSRKLAAIRYAHRLAGVLSPTDVEQVRAVLRGIRRDAAQHLARRRPLPGSGSRPCPSNMPDTLKGKRDRALLAFGMAGAFRRSELVALQVADLERLPEGLRVTIRRSKTDQEGAATSSRSCAVQAQAGACGAGLAERGWDHQRPGVPLDQSVDHPSSRG